MEDRLAAADEADSASEEVMLEAPEARLLVTLDAPEATDEATDEAADEAEPAAEPVAAPKMVENPVVVS